MPTKHARHLQDSHIATLVFLQVTIVHHILCRYSQSAWAAQLSVDLEVKLHKTVETYWIWNEKVEMVRKVVEENPFNSELFFWVDIGYLRTSGGR